MLRLAPAIAAAVGLAACMGGGRDDAVAAQADAAVAAPPVDAGGGLIDTGVAEVPAPDADGGAPASPSRPRRVAGGARPMLVLTLYSTPSGADVSVDGTLVGRTPTFWESEFDGREHEFTFVLPGYAMDRRRFVPTTTGHVHPALVKIAAEQPAATADAPPYSRR